MIDSATGLRDNQFQIFDPVGLINDAYAIAGGSSPLRFAVVDNGDSDDSSPKLWKTSPAGSPPQAMSPNSRKEAIARGRRELMEMIKDMPESFYELSLKDLVEHNNSAEDKKVALLPDPNQKRENRKKKKKTVSQKIPRSISFDNGGYLLKTSVFPISFGMSKRRKKSLVSTGSLSSASMAAKEYWWKTKLNDSEWSSSSGTSSSSSSRSSSTTSNRQGHSSRFIPGCCSFRVNK